MSQLENTKQIKGSCEPTREYEAFSPFFLLGVLLHRPPTPASNSSPCLSSNVVAMDKAGDHYISRTLCSPTLPSPRCFAPPNPSPAIPCVQLPTSLQSLPITPSPCVRQVSITYSGRNFNSQSTDGSRYHLAVNNL